MESNIYNELKERFLRPLSTYSFIMYFVFVIILLGGMGVIVSLCRAAKESNWTEVPLNLMTYSLALLIPACIEIILQYFPYAKNKVSLVILIIVCLVATCLLAFTENLIVAILCVLLAWFFWIIANSDNTYLDDNAYNNSIKKDLNAHGKDWDQGDTC